MSEKLGKFLLDLVKIFVAFFLTWVVGGQLTKSYDKHRYKEVQFALFQKEANEIQYALARASSKRLHAYVLFLSRVRDLYPHDKIDLALYRIETNVNEWNENIVPRTFDVELFFGPELSKSWEDYSKKIAVLMKTLTGNFRIIEMISTQERRHLMK